MYIPQKVSSYKIKILIVGSAGSGKKSLCSKYLSGFSRSFEKTLGVDIYVKEEVNDDDEKITFACWVCSPEKRFQYYWHKFFRGSLGAFILYDITNRNSFKECSFWEDTIRLIVSDIPIILVGNKLDMKSERVIDYDEAKSYSIKNEYAGYIETSVEENINISKAFEILNEKIYEYIEKSRVKLEPLYL